MIRKPLPTGFHGWSPWRPVCRCWDKCPSSERSPKEVLHGSCPGPWSRNSAVHSEDPSSPMSWPSRSWISAQCPGITAHLAACLLPSSAIPLLLLLHSPALLGGMSGLQVLAPPDLIPLILESHRAGKQIFSSPLAFLLSAGFNLCTSPKASHLICSLLCNSISSACHLWLTCACHPSLECKKIGV